MLTCIKFSHKWQLILRYIAKTKGIVSSHVCGLNICFMLGKRLSDSAPQVRITIEYVGVKACVLISKLDIPVPMY